MPAGPGLHDPNHLPLQSFQPGPMPQQQPQLPAWAADFQRLHIASPQPQAFVPQTRQAPSSWHLDFMKQQQATQATSIQQVQHQTPVHSMFGGVPRYGAFNQSHFEPSFAERPDMTVAEGKQRAQDGPQQFGDAAFDQAFEQLDQEVALTAEQHAQADETAAAEALREREAERIAAEIEQEHAEQVQQFEQIDAEELKQSRRNLFSMYEPGHDDPLADQHDILDQIEAEAQERFQQELQNIPEQTQDMRPQDPVLDADELSRTAAQLLDSVSHDQSDKFQQSNFLELMRRLRDKEVRVEGNEMVEVRDSSQSFSSSTFEHRTASSTPVSEFSEVSSVALSTASSATSLDAMDVQEDLYAMPQATATAQPSWINWTDGNGVQHHHVTPADVECCKRYGCRPVKGHVHDAWSQGGWSDIADTNSDADLLYY